MTATSRHQQLDAIKAQRRKLQRRNDAVKAFFFGGGVVAFVALVVYGIWWQHGTNATVTITVAAKQYKPLAPEDQNWQITDTEGHRYSLGIVTYKTTKVGQQIRCLRTGREYSVPVLQDGLYHMHLCHILNL